MTKMYLISIQILIRVDVHKKFHSVLITSSRDIKLRTSSILKKSFQFHRLPKLYWLQFCLRVITKCMNLPLGCMNLPFTMVYDGGEKGIDMPCKCHVGAVLGQPHLRLTMVEPDFWFVTSYTLFFKSTRNEKRKYFKHSMCGFYIWKV